MTVDAEVTRSLSERLRSLRLSRRLRRLPLLVHLVGYALIVLIPALLFSAFLILQFSAQQEEIASGQVNDTAQIISNAVDREVFGLITSAKVLASSPSIEQGELAPFYQRTTAALRNANTDATLVDPSLRVVLSTREPFPMAPYRLAGADTIDRVFKTRQPQVSGAYFGERAGDFVFHVAVPVMRGNEVAYVLAITKLTRHLNDVIVDRDLPRDWSAIIKDRQNHRVFAAVSAGGKLEPQEGISYTNPSIVETLGGGMSDDLIEASTVSSLSGWTTTVAVPNDVIGRPVMRSWMLLVSAGILLLLFSVTMGVYFGRRIATPILALSKQAEAIGHGLPAITISTDIAEVGEVSKVLAHASRARREAEEQNRFLMREMTHRAKNQYALIAAIARRAAKESADTTQFLATLSEALNSLARSADLLAGRGWDSAEIGDLVRTQLQAFGADGDQITLDGPKVQLNPSAAQTIGLALHELATNAAKYGALSVEDGTVAIAWSLGERFELVWTERGGPKVVQPKRSGFGTLVTQKMTARGLGGDVAMDYAETGVVWKLTTPVESVIAH